MISLARDPQSNGPVKRRQLGVALVDLGEAAAAAEFDELISNGSERRTLGIACLDRLARQVSDDDALSLVVKIY